MRRAISTCTHCVYITALRSSEGLKPQERLLYLPLTPMSVVFVHSRQDEQKSNQNSTALQGDILTPTKTITLGVSVNHT